MKAEITGDYPRLEEIKAYYETGAGKHDSLIKVLCDLTRWFSTSSMIVGRGGSHVWVASQESGKRYLMVSE